MKQENSAKEVVIQVLSVLAVGGVVVTAAVAPGILPVVASLLSRKSRLKKESIYRALRYAKNHRWVKVVEMKRGIALQLTERGARYLTTVSLDAPLKPQRWDGKWRVAIFDIPDTKKSNRDTLRRTLRTLGFVQLQESVWVTPYPCANEVAAMKQLYELGKNLRLITADTIEGQEELLVKFDLVPTAR